MDENMTDYQFETLLKMILEIVKGCETKEEAVNKMYISVVLLGMTIYDWEKLLETLKESGLYHIMIAKK